MSCNSCLHRKRCYFYNSLNKLFRDLNGQFRNQDELQSYLFSLVSQYCRDFDSYYAEAIKARKAREAQA